MPRCTATVDKYFVGYHTLQFMFRGGIELSYDDRAHLLEGKWFWPANPEQEQTNSANDPPGYATDLERWHSHAKPIGGTTPPTTTQKNDSSAWEK